MKREIKKKIIRKRGKQQCPYCLSKTVPQWQDYEKMRDFLTQRGRIMSSLVSGVCVKHQRKLARAIKQARHLALLPFTVQE